MGITESTIIRVLESGDRNKINNLIDKMIKLCGFTREDAAFMLQKQWRELSIKNINSFDYLEEIRYDEMSFDKE